MSGTIIVNDRDGFSLNSAEFDLIAIRTKAELHNIDNDLKEKIYELYDEGCISMVDVSELINKDIKLFYIATKMAYNKWSTASGRHLSMWEDIIESLERDPRF